MDLKTLEAAATWYVDLHDGDADAAQIQAWRAWLASSPAHADAWSRVENLQRQWSMVPRQAALSGLGAAQASRREVLKVLAVLLAVGGGTWLASEQIPYRSLLAQQRTGTGERRSLLLDDGTHLELNVSTALDVSFDAQVRVIKLYRGEILISTASDPALRPFIVHTSNGSVRALGTRFTVRQLADQTLVSVLQSAVEVRPQYHLDHVLRLEAGKQAHFDSNTLGRAQPLHADSTAWVQGMLSVNDWSLGDFIDELGRYRPGVLRCAPAIREMRISGAFRIDDTDIALANLPKFLPVKVQYLSRYWVKVEPA